MIRCTDSFPNKPNVEAYRRLCDMGGCPRGGPATALDDPQLWGNRHSRTSEVHACPEPLRGRLWPRGRVPQPKRIASRATRSASHRTLGHARKSLGIRCSWWDIPVAWLGVTPEDVSYEEAAQRWARAAVAVALIQTPVNDHPGDRAAEQLGDVLDAHLAGCRFRVAGR